LNKTGSIQININSQFDIPVIVAATTILYLSWLLNYFYIILLKKNLILQKKHLSQCANCGLFMYIMQGF